VAGAIGLFLIACLLVAGALGLWATGNTFFPRATPSSSASATAVSKPAGSLATSQPAPLTATLPPTTETPRSTDTLVAPTDTPVPPTPTFTSAAAAAPATFTSTPEPPASASTPLPKLEIIAPQNLDGLHQLAQWMDTQSGDAAFSPDSRSLAGANRDIAVVIWDSLTGQKLHSFSFSPWWISGIIYSPDGKTLAVGVCSKTSPTGCAEADVLLLDIATGQVLHTLTGHVGSVEGLAFSPDGKTLATGSIDSTIRLWDVATGQRLHSLTKHTYAVSAVAFSPDGKTLASASGDKTVRLWDPATGQLLRTLQGHTYWVYSVAYSPDGKMLASGSGDLTVRLWDPATGQLLRTLKDHGDGVNGIAFSPDGKLLASVVGIRVLYSTSHDSFVRLWDPATGQLLQKIEGPPAGLRSVSFSPDGKMLVAAVWDYTIRVWGVMK
jgi:WD40 repeat protein